MISRRGSAGRRAASSNSPPRRHSNPGLHGELPPSRHVNIGQVEASRTALRLHTVLGSCVSVCLYEPHARIGGMNHILVPSSESDGGCEARYGLESRCGVEAMELLINAMMSLGADRRKFLAKAFGGGNVLPMFREPTLGELNIRFVRQFLKSECIPLVAERLGGEHAVKVIFHTATALALVRSVDGFRLPALVREETEYYNTDVSIRFPSETPTLF